LKKKKGGGEETREKGDGRKSKKNRES